MTVQWWHLCVQHVQLQCTGNHTFWRASSNNRFFYVPRMMSGRTTLSLLFYFFSWTKLLFRTWHCSGSSFLHVHFNAIFLFSLCSFLSGAPHEKYVNLPTRCNHVLLSVLLDLSLIHLTRPHPLSSQPRFIATLPRALQTVMACLPLHAAITQTKMTSSQRRHTTANTQTLLCSPHLIVQSVCCPRLTEEDLCSGWSMQ